MNANQIILLIILIIPFACTTPDTDTVSDTPIGESAAVTGYDSLKAAEYGADDYGMKKYVMAFLKRGPNRDLDSAKAAELQMAHMQNIRAMAKAGKLVLAGPFFGDGELRGIYIFDAQSIEEAEELTNSDPAIQEGSLEMELLEWYGSAGLMEVNIVHESLARNSMVSEE